MTINWRESLAVGHKDIDDDHKRIFNLINEYETAVKNRDLAELKLVFKNLLNYADSHFKREEDLMFRMGYEGANDHAKHHAILTARLEAFHKGIVVKKKFDVAGVSKFLKQWLVDHIIAEDMKFKKFMDARKTGQHLFINQISAQRV